MIDESHIIRLILELRRLGITDTRTLSAIERVPRQLFVPDAFLNQAYDNIALPIGCHQTLSQPIVVARMTQALKITERHKVLEVGTGSGYQALVLAQLCRRLYTIERHKPLYDQAVRKFETLKQTNIVPRFGDGSCGWPEQAPFERIMVTAAAPDVPPMLADQLAIGGLMVLPIGIEASDQWLVRVTRTEDGFETEELEPVRFVPLIAGMPLSTKS